MGDGADMLRESEELVREWHEMGQCEDWCPHCDAEEKAREIAIAKSPGSPDEMDAYED